MSHYPHNLLDFHNTRRYIKSPFFAAKPRHRRPRRSSSTLEDLSLQNSGLFAADQATGSTPTPLVFKSVACNRNANFTVVRPECPQQTKPINQTEGFSLESNCTYRMRDGPKNQFYPFPNGTKYTCDYRLKVRHMLVCMSLIMVLFMSETTSQVVKSTLSTLSFTLKDTSAHLRFVHE